MDPLKGSSDSHLHASSGAVAHRQFRDTDELATFLPEDIRLTQLECQTFRCHAMALNLEVLQFNFNHVNRRLHAVGHKHKGFLTFAMILHSQGQPGIENGLPITEDYLFGLDPDRGANLVFPGNAIYCAVYIQPDVFETCAQAMGRSELNSKFLAANYVYMPESFAPLRAYLKQLYALLSQSSPLLQKPDFQRLILQDFLPLLMTVLPAPSGRKTPARLFRRARLVQQAHEYMQNHIDQVLTLTDLCRALDTSSRALCYGFQEMFGTSPMSYLKILRLQGVHRALKAAEASSATVTEIATRFGFYHGGYFAHDYKQMFGELPSKTLRHSNTSNTLRR